jgi:hypothetical protein
MNERKFKATDVKTMGNKRKQYIYSKYNQKREKTIEQEIMIISKEIIG